MQIEPLLTEYRGGTRTPEDIVELVYDRIESENTNVWISTRDEREVRAEAAALGDPDESSLYGVPFAVKDNIDYAGLPTTAGCPAYAYEPSEHATVVDRLIDAGALLIGKTNMDQFATGLVGTRSPYGACRNVNNTNYISGGSSSGSAVAVARNHVAFALGTDTGGSGRVPAAFNGLVGLKPTRGALSTDGVVPACESLDSVSIFTHDCMDALRVEQVAAGFDPNDPYSRQKADDLTLSLEAINELRVGVPASGRREFFGDEEAEQLFIEAVNELADIGEIVEIDPAPFYRTTELLYSGPWVGERFAAVGEFIEANSGAVHPVVEEIIRRGESYSAVEAFEALHELKALKRRATSVMDDLDTLVMPTTGTIYTINEVHEEPIDLNANLGYYTNFMNLLDLSAVSVPTGTFDAGPTFGITVIGDAFEDSIVGSVGSLLRSTSGSDQ
jgi:allophanate hydrolase